MLARVFVLILATALLAGWVDSERLRNDLGGPSNTKSEPHQE